MNIYIQLLLVAAIAIYIVDLSGFTESWRSALARLLHISEKALKPLPPFDCSLCATWWTCLIYSLCLHQLSLPIIAYCALLSFLSYPISQFLTFIKEGLLRLVNLLLSAL